MKIHNNFPMPGSECARYALLLPQLHQNTLDGDVEASLRAHLGSCAYCQAQLSAYDRVDASLRSYLDHFSPMAPSAGDLVLVPALPAHLLRRRATGVMAIAAALLIVLLSGTIFTLFGRYHASVGGKATATVATATIPAIPATALDPQSGLPAHWVISSIQVLAPDDVWAVGNFDILSGGRVTQILTLFAHFNGHRWRAIPGAYQLGPPSSNGTDQPFIGSVFTISMDSPADGWAGGDSFYHYTNGQWERVSVPAASGGVDKIVMLSANDGWAVVSGNQAGSSVPYNFMHYQNGVWTLVTTPFSSNFLSNIADFSFDSTGHGWVVGSNGEIGSYAHGQWQEEPPIPITGIDLFKITAVSPDDLWAAGRPHNSTLTSPGVILHFDGHSWHQVAVPGLNGYGDGPFNEEQPPIDMVSATEGWLPVWTQSGQGADIATLLHYADGQWQQVALPVHHLGIMYAAGFSTTDGWLDCTDLNSGGNGHVNVYLLRYHNGVWSIYDTSNGQ